MTEKQLRVKIGKFIFFFTIGLFALIILYAILGGFDEEEFASLLRILGPIGTVYLTGLGKYVIENRFIKKTDETGEPSEENQVSRLYSLTSRGIIYLHFILLFILISIQALFNGISFKALLNFILLIEVVFGAYVGVIMSSLFHVDPQKNE